MNQAKFAEKMKSASLTKKLIYILGIVPIGNKNGVYNFSSSASVLLKDWLPRNSILKAENFSTTQFLAWVGISFLLFYPWGIEVCRGQSSLISKCPTTKPACDVYFHNIVQRGSYCPFMLYADYLSNVATQYPSLCFHVFFLVDDSLKNGKRSKRDAIIFDSDDRFPFTSSYGKYGFREIQHFTTRYDNMNITIMALSEYMNMIPLNLEWRNVPLSHLTFYARIFSVWLNGGVAMDLNYFNDNYNLKLVDHRISAILKQHNDGIKVEEYGNVLNQIKREEEKFEFFAMFNKLIHLIFNDTRTFITKNLHFPQITAENGASQNKSLLRMNRNKRDASTTINDKNNKSEVVSNNHVQTINSTKETDLKKNEYQLLKFIGNDASKALQIDNSSTINDINKTMELNKSEILPKTKNNTNKCRVVSLNEFSVLSNGVTPSQGLPEQQIGKAGKSENDKAVILTIDSDGMFVAASSSLHPFLTHYLISIRCPYMQPKFSIQDTLFLHCSGIFDKDSYCNNIYVL